MRKCLLFEKLARAIRAEAVDAKESRFAFNGIVTRGVQFPRIDASDLGEWRKRPRSRTPSARYCSAGKLTLAHHGDSPRFARESRPRREYFRQLGPGLQIANALND